MKHKTQILVSLFILLFPWNYCSAKTIKPAISAGILASGYVQPANPIGAYVPDQGQWRMVVEFDIASLNNLTSEKALILFDSAPIYTPAAKLQADLIPANGKVEKDDFDSKPLRQFSVVAGPSEGTEAVLCQFDITEPLKEQIAQKTKFLALRFSLAGFDPNHPAPAGRSVHNCRLMIQKQGTRSPASANGHWIVSPDKKITDHAQPEAEGSLAWTLNQIGSTPATVEFPGSSVYSINQNLTIPANVDLQFNNGAVLVVADKKTLTINGGIEARQYNIFHGPGKIAGRPKLSAVSPQWFGAAGDGEADDTAALQRAADFACRSGVLCVDLNRGRYRITKTLNLTNTREPGTIARDGLRMIGSSMVGTSIIGDTGDGHAVIETSGSQWLEFDNFGITVGSKNPSSVGLFTGIPKACPQCQNQVYHISVAMADAPQQNGGLGSIGIWNFAAEEHTYRSIYVHANRPLVLTASNGPKAGNGMFTYAHSYVDLLEIHSLGVTTLSGECFLFAQGKHAPAVTTFCANSLSMENTYIGSTGTGKNTAAFEIHGSLVNLTYSGTIEGVGTFAKVHGLLIGSNTRATFGSVADPKTPVLLIGPEGQIQNCDMKFTLEDAKNRNLFGTLNEPKTKPYIGDLSNTTIKTNQQTRFLNLPNELQKNARNLTISNPQTKLIFNEQIKK